MNGSARLPTCPRIRAGLLPSVVILLVVSWAGMGHQPRTSPSSSIGSVQVQLPEADLSDEAIFAGELPDFLDRRLIVVFRSEALKDVALSLETYLFDVDGKLIGRCTSERLLATVGQKNRSPGICPDGRLGKGLDAMAVELKDVFSLELDLDESVHRQLFPRRIKWGAVLGIAAVPADSDASIEILIASSRPVHLKIADALAGRSGAIDLGVVHDTGKRVTLTAE